MPAPEPRRAARAVWVGGVRLGGGAPVAVEAALGAPTGRDRAALDALRAQAAALERAGADLLRLDCASPADAEILGLLAPSCALPLLADIGGGDPALALAAVEAGARGVWLSPQAQDDAALAELAALAATHGCMLGLRLGLPGLDGAPAAPSPPIELARLALRETGRLAALGCTDIVVALRLDDPLTTMAALRALGRACDWPLAIAPGAAASAAGPGVGAAMAIGLPLGQGLGDLVRLPAAADAVAGTRVAVQAIRTLGLRPRGVELDAEDAFLRLRPDAQDVLAALEDRLAHVSAVTVLATLSASASIDPSGPSVVEEGAGDDPPASLRLRIACGGASAAARRGEELVARIAGLIEDRIGAWRARDLHRLAAELDWGGRDPAARAWIEAAVALFALERGRAAPVVWGSRIGESAWMRLTGRRPAWQTASAAAAGSAAGGAAGAADDLLARSALSTALGLALAAQRAGRPADVVAVVDPAALVGGAGLAAIRAARASGARLLIVLLDADLDVEDAGLPAAVAAQMSRLVSSAPYLAMRDLGKAIIRTLPGPGYDLARRAEEFARGLAAGGFMFDELGVYYVGPVAGRRYDQLLPVLRNLRDARRDQPVLLHVAAAVRGKPAAAPVAVPGVERLRAQLDHALAADGQAMLIVQTAALPQEADATLAARHPGRVLRAAEASHHGLGLARGAAAGGLRPLLLLDRRGVWPEAGEALRSWSRLGLPATLLVDLGHGASDLAWLDAPPLDLAVLPGIAVLHAAAVEDLAGLIAQARERPGQPVIVAFDRDGPLPPGQACVPVDGGAVRTLRSGGDVAILALGRGVRAALAAAERLAGLGIAASVIDPVVAQPFDAGLARRLASSHAMLIALDDPPMAARIGDAARAALGPEDAARLHVVTASRRAVADLVAAAMAGRASAASG